VAAVQQQGEAVVEQGEAAVQQGERNTMHPPLMTTPRPRSFQQGEARPVAAVQQQGGAAVQQGEAAVEQGQRDTMHPPLTTGGILRVDAIPIHPANKVTTR
jgi:hypothetical protein